MGFRVYNASFTQPIVIHLTNFRALGSASQPEIFMFAVAL